MCAAKSDDHTGRDRGGSVTKQDHKTGPHAVNVTVLRGRGGRSSATICQWNPVTDLLATDSDDSTAVIWNMLGSSGPRYHVLDHQWAMVLALDWRRDGHQLATGSSNGYVRTWSENGELIRKFTKKHFCICGVKWSRNGKYILSAGSDKTAIIWDAKTGEDLQTFTGSVFYKVDWLTNDSFASCSAEPIVQVYERGNDEPTKTLHGHKDCTVHELLCDHQRNLLASFSNDAKIQIWNIRKKTCDVLPGHSQPMSTIKWNPTQHHQLASASVDTTVKLWDVERRKCIHTFTEHTDTVLSLAFSPDGKYLASGSFDRFVHIWNVDTMELVHSYHGKGRISEVCWNLTGYILAVIATNPDTVSVLKLF